MHAPPSTHLYHVRLKGSWKCRVLAVLVLTLVVTVTEVHWATAPANDSLVHNLQRRAVHPTNDRGARSGDRNGGGDGGSGSALDGKLTQMPHVVLDGAPNDRLEARPLQTTAAPLVRASAVGVTDAPPAGNASHTSMGSRVRMRSGSLFASVAAGALTGILETLLMYPLENIKTQQQLWGGSLLDLLRRTLAAGDHRLHAATTSGSNSGFAPLRWFAGWSNLYRGMSPVVLGAVPTQAIRWGTYELFCTVLFGGACVSLRAVFFCGMFSGCITSFVTGVPVESVKTQIIASHSTRWRRQPPSSTTVVIGSDDEEVSASSSDDSEEGPDPVRVESPNNASADDWPYRATPPPQAAVLKGKQTTVATGVTVPSSPLVTVGKKAPAGFSGTLSGFQLKGWIPTVLKKVLNQTIRFPVHHAVLGLLCASMLAEPHSLAALATTSPAGAESVGVIPSPTVVIMPDRCAASAHPLLSFLAGFSAGAISIAMTQPVDVIKTRMQGMDSMRYGNTFRCFLVLLREEGPWVFMHGIVPRALRTSLGAGITFALYPVIKQVLLESTLWGG